MFYPLWQEDADVWLLRGGRGGGKSEVVCDKLLDKALTDKYARCYFGRKVFEDVRGSIYKTLIESIKKQKLEKWFTYSEADHSTMIITAKGTKNQFIPFGSDKPDRIKSIKDPTDIICEEANQFEFRDFQEFMPTLRTERGTCSLYMMFNTKDVYSDHWIPRIFYPEFADKKMEVDALSSLNIKHIFANFTDNYFIDQERYRNILWLSSGGNSMLFEAMANGAWGMKENEDPWLYALDIEKIFRPSPFIPSFPVHLSFDFNRDPMTCTSWQKSPSIGMPNSFLRGIREFTGERGLENLCRKIKGVYPGSILFVTGDSNGHSKYHAHALQYNSSDERTYEGKNDTNYRIIQRTLDLNENQMHTFSKNMEHSDSRQLSNIMFAHHPNFTIDPIGCPILRKECQIATVDPKSSTPSKLLKDREGYKMDAFDSMRYIFQRYYKTYPDTIIPKRA